MTEEITEMARIETTEMDRIEMEMEMVRTETTGTDRIEITEMVRTETMMESHLTEIIEMAITAISIIEIMMVIIRIKILTEMTTTEEMTERTTQAFRLLQSKDRNHRERMPREKTITRRKIIVAMMKKECQRVRRKTSRSSSFRNHSRKSRR